MRRSLPARLVVRVVLAAALSSALAAEAADPPTGQYRAFWVDTFNTNLSDHADVRAVVDNARAARANALFAQVRRRGDSWYLDSLEGPAEIVAPAKARVDFSQAIPLEAARAGKDKNGRAYTLEVTATDRACQTRTASITVVVPHDQGH
jgi:hypothetical protein